MRAREFHLFDMNGIYIKSGISLNKYWIWCEKKTLDSGNKNDLLYLMYEMKMLYHFICIIVYKPRPNSLSLLMIRLFLFDSHPILRFWFHLIQILQRHNSQNL